MAGIGYSSGYSPYTGAGNLALAMGANPSFGGYTGGYQEGGYTPSNVGGVNYASSAPAGYAWSASGLVPLGSGQGGDAGVRAYNPAISGPPASFQAPTFTNSMSNWNPYGYGSEAGASTPSSSGDFVAPGGSSSPYPGFSQNSQGAWVADPSGGGASSFDQNSGMRGGAYSPMGTALANAAAFPNPNATSPSTISSNNYSTQNIMAGLFGGEDPNPGSSNPYQMSRPAMQTVDPFGILYPTNAYGAPTNAADSRSAATDYINYLMGNNSYAEQVATAYGPAGQGAVNQNYNPNIPGSSPLRPGTVSQNPSQNQTPSAYLYGNPQTSYPGVMAGMRQSAGNDAVSQQFGQAAGAGQALPYTPAPYTGGRY